ncbi:MAG: Dabb family protein [Clostridia bacterium]|nr:Dabb family protein [Clostridia bacterium]
MITHIVMWKFRDGTQAQAKQFLDGLQALDGVIPQIRYMETRLSCNEANTFNALLIVKFDSMEDLEAYKHDPRHLAAGKLHKELREDRAAMDYEE